MENNPLSKTKRWWVIGGAVLLSLLVLVAVFSLGVYVGRRGWQAGPPEITGPGRPPAGGDPPPAVQPPPGQAPAPWPQERPALQGRVRAIDPKGLSVNTAQGARFVRLTPETRLTRLTDEGEVAVQPKELQPGLLVAVFGPLAPDGRSLVAERIVILPQP